MLTQEELAQKAREARNAYAREWRNKNKDKVKGYMDRHWIKKAEEAMKPKKKKSSR